MKISLSILYTATFAGLATAIGYAVFSTPVFWPFIFLLLPMGAWAGIDIYFIWKHL